MKFRINTFEEMITYFKRPEVEFSHIEEITRESLKCIFIEEHTKEEAIQLLIAFWAKWGAVEEKPIFIERLDLDVE
jgi:sulfatase maturation enzyme AslB (radical SAM superfamily)